MSRIFPTFFGALFLAIFLIATTGASPAMAYTCGNGVVETGEQCDRGTQNSDVAPNGCRTDCRFAYCGDSVIDRNEQCDDGNNSDTMGLKCRRNCTLPRCGDGVVDDGTRSNMPRNSYTEQCDDANTDDSDGCLKSCKTCVQLDQVGNIEITQDTHICPNDYEMDDYGDYGAIIIKQPGITLNCHGASITGTGRGVGIMVFRSDNVKIKNCKLFGYETGIKGEDVRSVTLNGNHLCKNGLDIDFGDATSGGRNNACHSPGSWNDPGKQGCSRRLMTCNMPSVTLPSKIKAPANLGPGTIPQQGAPSAPQQQKTVKPVKPMLKAPVMKTAPVFKPRTSTPDDDDK